MFQKVESHFFVRALYNLILIEVIKHFPPFALLKPNPISFVLNGKDHH